MIVIPPVMVILKIMDHDRERHKTSSIPRSSDKLLRPLNFVTVALIISASMLLSFSRGEAQ